MRSRDMSAIAIMRQQPAESDNSNEKQVEVVMMDKNLCSEVKRDLTSHTCTYRGVMWHAAQSTQRERLAPTFGAPYATVSPCQSVGTTKTFVLRMFRFKYRERG